MAGDLWPWLAVAGLGALHGLNPATGWVVAAVWGVRSGERAQAWRALLPIAAGHAGSVGLVAAAVGVGVSLKREWLIAGAAALLAVVVAWRLCGGIGGAAAARTAHAGLALWSFAVATAHGAGLMLVPALVPLCASGRVAGEAWTGAAEPLVLAFAAVGVHAAAMLAVTGAVASGACRLWRRRPAAA